jgi:hypothetical protein
VIYAFISNKIYCEEKSLVKQKSASGGCLIHWIRAYNGEKMDWLTYDSYAPKWLIRPTGSVRTENVIPVNRYDPRYCGLYIDGIKVSSFISDNVIYKGNEMVKNKNCEIFEKTINNGDKYTVWLAKDIFYRPVRIKIEKKDLYNNQRSILELIETTYGTMHNNIIFPRETIKKRYTINEETNNLELSQKEKIIFSEECDLNAKIADSFFEVDFPKGMEIYDSRIGQKITIK